MSSTQQEVEIVVFTKPACVQCNATYKGLKKAGYEDYEKVDISVDLEARDFVLSLGYLQAPVVVVGRVGRPDEHWSGFRPGRIKQIIIDHNALYNVA